MTRQRLFETLDQRNAALVEARVAGDSILELATEFDISKQRVSQLLSKLCPMAHMVTSAKILQARVARPAARKALLLERLDARASLRQRIYDLHLDGFSRSEIRRLTGRQPAYVSFVLLQRGVRARAVRRDAGSTRCARQLEEKPETESQTRTLPRANPPLCWTCGRLLSQGGWQYVVAHVDGYPRNMHAECARRGSHEVTAKTSGRRPKSRTP